MADEIRAIVTLGLRAQVVAHVRCTPEDVAAALATGIDGVHLFFGSSPQLRQHSHGRTLQQIAAQAAICISMVRDAGKYVRFSAEDAFRTPLSDIIPIFDAAVAAGVQRLGLPDTVGCATPWQVAERIEIIHQRYPGVGIEFHGHNDTGCAIANALAALNAGADCIDVTALGIGERNGITSLSGLIAALISNHPVALQRYQLRELPALDQRVAALLDMPIPFNAPITSSTAFTHKAGVHTNAVLRAAETYEKVICTSMRYVHDAFVLLK